MPSLSSQLGADYMDQFYRRSFIRVGNKIHSYSGHISPAHIATASIPFSGQNTGWVNDKIETDSITSMDDFGWPRLGYREFTSPNDPKQKFVYNVSSTRSAMRGLKDEFIGFAALPVVSLLGDYSNLRHFKSSEHYVQEIFNPKFTPFLEGVDSILNGDTACFALSENLAVSLSCNQGMDRIMDVFYRERVIGSVDANKNVIIPHRYAKIANTQRLFQGKVKQ